MKIVFKHPLTNEVKEAPVGFSWTTLFFGIFVSLIRGDFKWALIMFLAAFPSLGLSWLVFPFIYNKLYIKDIVKKGFKVKEVIDGDLEIVKYKLGIPLERL